MSVQQSAPKTLTIAD